MGVVADIADRIIVMRQGRLVEAGPAQAILQSPAEDYTKALIAAVPRLTARRPTNEKREVVLRADHLRKAFGSRAAGLFRRRPPTTAVDDISFELGQGETLGVVGESGSGKTTVARCLARLTDLDDGHVRVGDVQFSELKGAALRRERRRIQVIFQDPYASLNPRQTVEKIVGTPLRVRGVSAADARERSREVLSLVGLGENVLGRYPHEFSGGQRQRIGIARALVCEPDVLVADEAVSSLDVSVQAQVLQLLDQVKRRLGLAMIFITHDLRVAAQICDRVIVMKSGKIVEEGWTREVFESPKNAYTRSLLAAIPGRHWLSDHMPTSRGTECPTR